MSATITLLGSAILALLLAGYLAQHYLPPPKPAIIGIDLGTTYSCVGVYHAVTGNVSVIADDRGKKCIPSIVAFIPGRVLVGYDALDQAEHNPKNTFYDAKRFIGKTFTKSELRDEARAYQFRIHLGPKNRAFFLSDHHEGHITPELIGSHILKTLKETAVKNITRDVNRAVITVPAEFDEVQRNATRKAGEMAGLEVVRIINEPTAAAMAYGLHQTEGMRTVIVVDFGGGTLDVSLLNVQDGMFLTMAMAGNNHLGGQDLNLNLMTYLLSLIQKQFKQELHDPEDLQSLRERVEQAKLHLTYNPSALIKIDLKSINSRFEYRLKRTEFEDINVNVFHRVLEPVIRVLTDVGLHKSEIDDIVLVGGSSRIPRVREIIHDYFEKEPNVSIDPELAVTHGVAVQAGVMGGMWPLKVSAVERSARVHKTRL